jgi:hypothetical protein
VVVDDDDENDEFVNCELVTDCTGDLVTDVIILIFRRSTYVRTYVPRDGRQTAGYLRAFFWDRGFLEKKNEQEGLLCCNSTVEHLL